MLSDKVIEIFQFNECLFQLTLIVPDHYGNE